ncbi:MAG: hypothetical protein KF852_15730 [Saprospiraceae bacterium]|nr:hypothetical protein [Saprospiraceae bacterium]
MSLRYTLLVLSALFSLHSSGKSVRHVAVPFYSSLVEIAYHQGMQVKIPVRSNEQSIVHYYHKLLETDYTTLLNDLEQKRQELKLNDWMYYALLRSSVNQIFSNHTAFEKELIAWFLVSHSGYDTRLMYTSDAAYLYLYVEEEVFELPFIREDRRNFTYIPYPVKYPIVARGAFLLDFTAMRGGKALSFQWKNFPDFPARPLEKKLQLRHRDTLYDINVTLDRTIVEIIANQPIVEEGAYFRVPMSPLLAASLLPQLERIISGKSRKEALEILVSFTRSSFVYQDDKVAFGRSKPMIAEEVFFYPQSDCEDRAVLLFHLVKSLLNLEVIVIAFPDHISIGIEADIPCAATVSYRDRRYCICDPTGPVNSSDIGRWPAGYEGRSYEILEIE